MGSPKIKMIFGERRERGAISVVTNSNSPSGAILDAGETIQEKFLKYLWGKTS